MPFQKGHSGFKKPKNYRKTQGKTKDPHATLDLYNIKSRFKKIGKGRKYIDPDKVDYYLNNGMDVTELYGTDEEWDLGYWYNEDGKKVSYYEYKKRRDEGLH